MALIFHIHVYMEQNDYVVFFQLTAELTYKMKKSSLF